MRHLPSLFSRSLISEKANKENSGDATSSCAAFGNTFRNVSITRSFPLFGINFISGPSNPARTVAYKHD